MCTKHNCQARLMIERAYVRIDSDCGRRSPTFGQFFRVCEMRTADQEAFYTRQILLHATVVSSYGFNFEMWLPVDSVHGEIRAESLQKTPS
jgi:hypothetical protein